MSILDISQFDTTDFFVLLVLIWLLILLAQSPLLLQPNFYLYFGFGLGLIGTVFAFVAPTVGPELALGALGVVPVTLASAFAGGYFWNGVEGSLYLAACGLLFVVVNQFERSALREYLRLFFLALLILLLPVIVYRYFLQGALFGWAGFLNFPAGGFRNPNVLARFLGLGGLFFLLTSREKLFSGLGIILLVLACWTGSRGAMLGLAGALIYRFRYFFLRNLTRRLLLLVAVALLVVLLVGKFTYITNLQRVKLVGETYRLFERAPLFGVGAWNFGLVYPQLSSDDSWQRHPHNIFLWILGAFGTAGLIFGGGLLWLLIRSYSALRYVPLIIFLLIHEMVDTMFWIPGILVLTVILLPMCFRGRGERLEWLEQKYVGRLAVFLLSVYLVLGSFTALRVNANYERGLKSAEKGDWNQAARLWRKSPEGSFTTAHLAVARAKEGNLAGSIELLKSAISSNQYDAFYPYLLGYYLETAGREEAARNYFELARSRDPRGMQELFDEVESDPAGKTGFTTAGFELENRGLEFGQLIAHPRAARVYLTFVDRTLAQQKYERALEQIELLESYPRVKLSTRRRLLRRKAFCYGKLNRPEKAKRVQQVYVELLDRRARLREQFHNFFYRRSGLDYGSWRR